MNRVLGAAGTDLIRGRLTRRSFPVRTKASKRPEHWIRTRGPLRARPRNGGSRHTGVAAHPAQALIESVTTRRTNLTWWIAGFGISTAFAFLNVAEAIVRLTYANQPIHLGRLVTI